MSMHFTIPNGFHADVSRNGMVCDRCSTLIPASSLERCGPSFDWVAGHGCAADSIPDAQLRAECERRGLISGNLAVVDLVRASDDSIRAEFIRRGLVDVDDCRRLCPATAEAAESREVNKPSPEQQLREVKRLTSIGAITPALVVAVLQDEAGPGIAPLDPRPDTSHYVDPLDFLEDA